MNKKARRLLLALFSFFIVVSFMKFPSEASTGVSKTVRVGYYQNEVFQEGASEKAVKSGYAYEYYRKISEFVCRNCRKPQYSGMLIQKLFDF